MRGTCARVYALEQDVRALAAPCRRGRRGMSAAAASCMTDRARPKKTSELAQLVSVEARLDGAVESARAEAAAVVDAARRRAEAWDAALAEEIAAQQAGIATESAVEVARQRAAIADAARAEVARYEAVRGDALVGLVHGVLAKLVAIARAEAGSS